MENFIKYISDLIGIPSIAVPLVIIYNFATRIRKLGINKKIDTLEKDTLEKIKLNLEITVLQNALGINSQPIRNYSKVLQENLLNEPAPKEIRFFLVILLRILFWSFLFVSQFLIILAFGQDQFLKLITNPRFTVISTLLILIFYEWGFRRIQEQVNKLSSIRLNILKFATPIVSIIILIIFRHFVSVSNSSLPQ